MTGKNNPYASDAYFNSWGAARRIWYTWMQGSALLVEARYQYLESSLQLMRAASHGAPWFSDHESAPPHTLTEMTQGVVALEERVYAIEDALLNMTGGDLNVVGTQPETRSLEDEQERIRARETLQQTLEGHDTLTERLACVEGKLDLLLAAFARIEARSQE